MESTYKLIGVQYGEFEGTKWAKLVILEKIPYNQGVGYRSVRKESSKCVYDLAVEIMNNWNNYENKDVYCSADLYGRICRVELAD